MNTYDKYGGKGDTLPQWAKDAIDRRNAQIKLGLFEEATPEENAKFGQFAPGVPERDAV